MKLGVASACTAVVILAAGAALFTLRSAPDTTSVDATPARVAAVPDANAPLKTDRPSTVDVEVPSPLSEDPIGMQNILPESDEGHWNGSDVIDTGPFIDADDDAGDYSFSPVSDVGEFLDPEAD